MIRIFKIKVPYKKMFFSLSGTLTLSQNDQELLVLFQLNLAYQHRLRWCWPISRIYVCVCVRACVCVCLFVCLKPRHMQIQYMLAKMDVQWQYSSIPWQVNCGLTELPLNDWSNWAIGMCEWYVYFRTTNRSVSTRRLYMHMYTHMYTHIYLRICVYIYVSEVKLTLSIDATLDHLQER